jgi:hypothetical protein
MFDERAYLRDGVGFAKQLSSVAASVDLRIG